MDSAQQYGVPIDSHARAGEKISTRVPKFSRVVESVSRGYVGLFDGGFENSAFGLVPKLVRMDGIYCLFETEQSGLGLCIQ
jgi:hypothetical protein